MKKLILFAFLLVTTNVSAQCPKQHDHGFCLGITKKGEPCKSVILMKGTNYCRMHNPAAIRCGAIKKDGKPCKMIVKKENELCKTHGK